MGRLGLRGLVRDLVSRVRYWRHWHVRAEARQLRAQYGAAAVPILRERIAISDQYEERRRLYRLHDELARTFKNAA